MSLLAQLDKLQDYARNIIRTWWRPVACIGIAGAVIVHGIVIPLLTRTSTDLTGLAALVTAVAAAFAVREWGKAQGNEDSPESNSITENGENQ